LTIPTAALAFAGGGGSQLRDLSATSDNVEMINVPYFFFFAFLAFFFVATFFFAFFLAAIGMRLRLVFVRGPANRAPPKT
jgi:hypothetical protein